VYFVSHTHFFSGGTTDITVHEVTGPNTVKEIHQACGGHWGGMTVNGEFYKKFQQ
jgi:hypothetical protein